MKGCEDVGPWTRRPRAQTMMKSDEVEAPQRNDRSRNYLICSARSRARAPLRISGRL
ncbi:MAG: hypothetical protein OXG37_03620 [Actinomycetia bacterium]|nr:hypothetical protein [Actinomycetes bacterium]